MQWQQIGKRPRTQCHVFFGCWLSCHREHDRRTDDKEGVRAVADGQPPIAGGREKQSEANEEERKGGDPPDGTRLFDGRPEGNKHHGDEVEGGNADPKGDDQIDTKHGHDKDIRGGDREGPERLSCSGEHPLSVRCDRCGSVFATSMGVSLHRQGVAGALILR